MAVAVSIPAGLVDRSRLSMPTLAMRRPRAAPSSTAARSPSGATRVREATSAVSGSVLRRLKR